MKPESGIYAILGQVCLFKTIGRECVEKNYLKCFLTERKKVRLLHLRASLHHYWLYFCVLSLQYKLRGWMSNFRWDIGKIWKGSTHNASWAPQHDSMLRGKCSSAIYDTFRSFLFWFSPQANLFLPFYFWNIFLTQFWYLWPKSETELKHNYLHTIH